MLKNLKELSRLKSKKWKEKIVDIFIFGSYVKGKISPNDIDICIVFRDGVDIHIVKEIERVLGEQYHISSLVVDNFFVKPHSLAKTLLLEGYSIFSGKKFAETFGLKAKILYSYDLSKEKNSRKVRFAYLFRGRKEGQGLVQGWGGEFLSNSIFIVPVEKDSEVQKVLEEWKVKYKRKKLMLMD